MSKKKVYIISGYNFYVMAKYCWIIIDDTNKNTKTEGTKLWIKHLL